MKTFFQIRNIIQYTQIFQDLLLLFTRGAQTVGFNENLYSRSHEIQNRS